MRVRVEVEDGQQPPWPGPFFMGVVLTPLAALIGSMVLTGTMADAGSSAYFKVGLIIGSVFAFPVTVLVLPLLCHAGASGPAFIAAGTLCAFFVTAISGSAPFTLAGTLAGLAVSIIFAWWAAGYRKAKAAFAIKA
jgi:hypothetical protein